MLREWQQQSRPASERYILHLVTAISFVGHKYSLRAEFLAMAGMKVTVIRVVTPGISVIGSNISGDRDVSILRAEGSVV